MSQSDPPILRAAGRLRRALDRLDAAAGDLTGAIRKSDTVTRRMQPLLKTAAQRLDTADRDKLNALSGRHAILQKSALKAQETLLRRHGDYEEKLGHMRTALDDQEALVNGLRDRLARHRRIEGALRRALLRTANQHLRSVLQDEEGFDLPEASHSYIQIDLPTLFEMMLETDLLLAADPVYDSPEARYRPVRVLEVGSGPGRNLHILRAAELLDHADLTGFDINPVQIAAGARAYDMADNLIVADALEFDYAPYDVIFSYRPFKDMERQQALEARIVQTMHTGAYLLAPLSYDLTLYPDLAPQGTVMDIWRKRDD